MGSSSDIEWTDATWNPTAGCSRVSPGCDNCYAMRFAHRFAGPGGRYEGLTRIGKRGVDWSGVVRLVPTQLYLPLRWKKPRRVFVNSMSDLFHPALSNEEIAAVFGVMAASPRHTFQILTKRPERALEWFRWLDAETGEHDPPRAVQCGIHAANYGADIDYLGLQDIWPLPNVWLGVSVEDRARKDRIEHLRQVPAAVRFLSCEPLLEDLLDLGLTGSTRLHMCLDIAGAIRNRSFSGMTDSDGRELTRAEAESELRRLLASGKRVLPMADCGGFDDQTGCPGHRSPGIDWVIVGGESGARSRPFHVAWARSIVEQCKAAGVACFVKQLGARPFRAPSEDETEWGPSVRGAEGDALDQPGAVRLEDRKGGNWDEWPADLRVREFPARAA